MEYATPLMMEFRIEAINFSIRDSSSPFVDDATEYIVLAMSRENKFSWSA